MKNRNLVRALALPAGLMLMVVSSDVNRSPRHSPLPGANLLADATPLVQAYVNFWNFLDILTFLAILFIWTKTVRGYSIASETAAGHHRKGI
jgi:hypothetical protein